MKSPKKIASDAIGVMEWRNALDPLSLEERVTKAIQEERNDRMEYVAVTGFDAGKEESKDKIDELHKENKKIRDAFDDYISTDSLKEHKLQKENERLKLIEKAYSSVLPDYLEYKHKNEELREEKKRLKSELDDINDSFKTVMDEKCAKDEVHCTCVPHFKRGVAELRYTLREVVEVFEFYDVNDTHLSEHPHMIVDCRVCEFDTRREKLLAKLNPLTEGK